MKQIADWPVPVYIHCAQGHGRTGTVAAAVLVAKGIHSTPEAAIDALQRVRPKLALNRTQLQFVRQICGTRKLHQPLAFLQRKSAILTSPVYVDWQRSLRPQKES